MSDVIATCGLIADPDEQQIPPLRCGMTNKGTPWDNRHIRAIALGLFTRLVEDGADFGDDFVDCN